jgi:serine protease Do
MGKQPETEQEHSVSSAPAPRSGRNISFTLPAMPRISLRNIAARTKAFGLGLVLIVGLLGGFVGSWLQDQTGDSLLSGSVSNQKKVVTSESELVSSIANTVGQSVVSINVSVTSESQDAYSRYFGFAEPREEQAAGTGVIISDSGLILTNRHVVPSGTTDVSVTLSDGTELDNVEVVGRTNDSDSLDIAILRITNAKGHDLKAATLGDSSKVAVGDEVVAIGNALGQFQNTVTTGIISGYGRSITAASDDETSVENLDNLFQTDAAINQGNSGGPLVNLNGQVIGINTAVASESQNIGFAIPINDIQGLIDYVVSTGKFERPYLGVRYIPLTADIAKEYELSVSDGAYVAPAAEGGTPSVIADGPAAKAGLKEGDIITKVNGVSVNESNSLTSLLGKNQPGDIVKLTVVNGKDTRSVSVKLGAVPSS